MMIRVPLTSSPLPGQAVLGMHGLGDDSGDGGDGTDWASIIGSIAQAGATVASTALTPAPGTCMLRNANGTCAVVSAGVSTGGSVVAAPTVTNTAAISAPILLGVVTVLAVILMTGGKK